jgi:hypothetical protein
MAITARYWRLVILNNATGLTKGLAELAMLGAGGVDLSVGGTASASSVAGSFSAANAFDKNTATEWQTGSTNNAESVSYDHGTAVAVESVRISWTSNINHLPLNGVTSLRLQHSDDGVSWSRALMLSLTSGDFVASTTAEFAINDLSTIATEPGGGFVFAGSALPTGMPTTYLVDGKAPYRDFEFGGFGRIAGTVKEDGSPDVPVRRRVRLHREQDGLLVREVWSDRVTGAYSFDYIDATKQYTVITYDYEHDYRAVIADNITPEAMP